MTETTLMLERWQQDRTELLLRFPFLGLLAMQLELRVGEWSALQTAATDGETVFGNLAFLKRLDDEERLFVLAHEVWHCAALHPQRRLGRDPELWNVAVDYETNAVLADGGLRVPKGALLHLAYRGRSAEDVYRLLRDTALPDRGPFADLHQPPRDGGWPGRREAPDARIWARRLQAAAQQCGTHPGALAGTAGLVVRELLRSRTPWQRILAQFVGRLRRGQASWTRPNRRHLSHGRYLPGQDNSTPRLAVALDTSGSTYRLLGRFLGELETILRAVPRQGPVRFIQFDARVQDDRLLDGPLREQAPPRLMGGGGTDFRPLFDLLCDDPPDALIILTDGYGPAPDRSVIPTLWAIPRSGQIPCRWGQRCEIF